MKNIKLFSISLCIFLIWCVGAASALTNNNVEYTVVNPYETSKGVVLTSCDNTSGWELGGTEAVMANDTLHYVQGTGAIKLTANAGNLAYIKYNISHNFSENRNIVVWAWIENIADRTNISEIKLNLVASDGVNKVENHINVQTLKVGWNSFVFPKSAFDVVESGNWSCTQTKLGLYIYPVAGGTTNVTFDYVGYDYSGQPTVVFTFDDGSASVYDIAYPIMEEYGLVGTAFVATNLINQNNCLTLAECKELQAAGWDIGGHTQNHILLNTVATDVGARELNNSSDWLRNNHFGKGAYIMAYPGGQYTEAVLPRVSDRYVLARTTMGRTDTPHVQNASYAPSAQYPMSIFIPTYAVWESGTNTTAFNGTVDRCIDQQGMLVFMFHAFDDNPANQAQYVMSTENFTKICAYVASKSSQIKNVPLSAYVNAAPITTTPIIGESVSCFNDSSLNTLDTDNVNTRITVPMTVLPDKGEVVVNVTQWDSQKVWSESADIHNIVTQHVIEGFPANTPIQINRDGVAYEQVTSNSAGQVTWAYTGGYSEHTFEMYAMDSTAVVSSTIGTGIWGAAMGMIVVATVITTAGLAFRARKGKLDPSTVTGTALGLVGLCVIVLMGAVVLGMF